MGLLKEINDVIDYGSLRNILGIWVWKSQDLTFGHPFAPTMFILLVGRPQMTLLYYHPGQLKKHRLAPLYTQVIDFKIHFQRDWKRYIVEKLEGRHTFPKDFETAAEEELKTEGLKVGMHLEIMDNRCVRRTRIATIDKLTGGGRISVKYFVSLPFFDQTRSDSIRTFTQSLGF